MSTAIQYTFSCFFMTQQFGWVCYIILSFISFTCCQSTFLNSLLTLKSSGCKTGLQTPGLIVCIADVALFSLSRVHMHRLWSLFINSLAANFYKFICESCFQFQTHPCSSCGIERNITVVYMVAAIVADWYCLGLYSIIPCDSSCTNYPYAVLCCMIWWMIPFTDVLFLQTHKQIF